MPMCASCWVERFGVPAGEVTPAWLSDQLTKLRGKGMLRKADAEQRLFADLDPATRAWALARYTLHPVAALEAPMKLDNFWEQAWPATVINCRRSTNPPEAPGAW
jgi:hypothetical protein